MYFNHLNLMVYKLPNFNKLNIYFRHIHLAVYVTAAGVKFGLVSYILGLVMYVERRGEWVGWEVGTELDGTRVAHRSNY